MHAPVKTRQKGKIKFMQHHRYIGTSVHRYIGTSVQLCDLVAPLVLILSTIMIKTNLTGKLKYFCSAHKQKSFNHTCNLHFSLRCDADGKSAKFNESFCVHGLGKKFR